MSINHLELSKLLELCEGEEPVRFCSLNGYFQHRMAVFKFFSKDELESVDEFISYMIRLKNKSGKRKSVKKILILVNNLVDVSLKHFNKIEITEIKEIKDELDNNKNEKEFYDYFLNILDELERERVSYRYIIDHLNLILELKGKAQNNHSNLFRKLSDYVNNASDLSLRMDDIQKYKKLKNRLREIASLGNGLSERIRSEEIVLSRKIPVAVFNSISFPQEVIKYEDERIFTIDDFLSPDLDGAFSIRKEDGYYNFKNYITNVPCFLRDNRLLAKDAYKRGVSFYIRDGKDVRDIHIDMLPKFLSWNYLSLKEGKFKDVIVFSYLIDDRGEIVNTDVDRRMIKVDKNLTPGNVNKILRSNNDFGEVQQDLKLYNEMVKKVISSSKDVYLNKLRKGTIDSLVSFPSILTNYYVGKEAEFTFYRINGNYTLKDSNIFYTHSVTPLRRFVSDINLAFFLNQKGVIGFDEKDLGYVESHAEDMVAHFNEKEELNEFVNKRAYFVKKYIK